MRPLSWHNSFEVSPINQMSFSEHNISINTTHTNPHLPQKHTRELPWRPHVPPGQHLTSCSYSISPEQSCQNPSLTKIPLNTSIPRRHTTFAHPALDISLQALECSLGCGSDQWPLAALSGGVLGSRNGGINNARSKPVISSISTEEAGGPTDDWLQIRLIAVFMKRGWM